MAYSRTCVHERKYEARDHTDQRGPIIMPKDSWCFVCDGGNKNGSWSKARKLTPHELDAMHEEIYPPTYSVTGTFTTDMTVEALENIARMFERDFVQTFDNAFLGESLADTCAVAQECTRTFGHSGSCNGLKRYDCGLDFVTTTQRMRVDEWAKTYTYYPALQSDCGTNCEVCNLINERTSGVNNRTYITDGVGPFAPIAAVVDVDDQSIEGRVMPGRAVKVKVYNANREPRPFAVVVGEQFALFEKFQRLQKLNAELNIARAEKKRARKNKDHWLTVENRQHNICEKTSDERYRLINELGVGDDGFKNDFL